MVSRKTSIPCGEWRCTAPRFTALSERKPGACTSAKDFRFRSPSHPIGRRPCFGSLIARMPSAESAVPRRTELSPPSLVPMRRNEPYDSALAVTHTTRAADAAKGDQMTEGDKTRDELAKMESELKADDTKAESLKYVYAVAVAALAAGAVLYLWLLLNWRSDTAPVWGVLGDAMGPFAGLISCAALFAAVIGVRLQTKELRDQRRQLLLQIQEMRESRDEMKAHTVAANRLAMAQESANALAVESLRAERFSQQVALRGVIAQHTATSVAIISARGVPDELRKVLGRLSLVEASESTRLSEANQLLVRMVEEERDEIRERMRRKPTD
jgi:hypothetical protein